MSCRKGTVEPALRLRPPRVIDPDPAHCFGGEALSVRLIVSPVRNRGRSRAGGGRCLKLDRTENASNRSSPPRPDHLYRVPEIVTRGRFPDGGESDSTWRTQEARHVGSDTIAPGF